ncbi:hypothetical protein [Ekhidna sp.]|uniref:hypothetical protein n=1 Tax=Ekhidna sp. TaxID=2608089 RepID=UPI003B50DADA
MKEFKKIESLLKSKAYSELTKEEREIVGEELTQEAYEEIRVGIYKLQGERIKVNKRVKQSLMAEFSQGKTFDIANIFQRRIPAYSLILPFILLIAVFFYRPTKEVPVIQDRMVEVMVHDTVRVVKTDTLWREKIVQVQQLVYVTKTDVETTSDKLEVPNRSLEDQKEVLDLVIRGE